MQNILYAIIGLVVIGGGVWLVTSQSGSSPAATNESAGETAEQSETREVVAEDTSGFGSLASLMGFGDKVRCEFDSVVEGETASGVFYTDGDRFRVESVQNTAGGQITSNVINDGDFVYTWGQTPQGEMALKMPNREVDSVDDSFESPLSDMSDEREYVDIDQEVNYDCGSWSVDGSKFVPPTGITFMDMASMMQEALNSLPEGFEMPEGIELPAGMRLPQ